MAPTVKAPFFDKQGDSFPNCGQEIELWRRATSLESTKRAAQAKKQDTEQEGHERDDEDNSQAVPGSRKGQVKKEAEGGPTAAELKLWGKLKAAARPKGTRDKESSEGSTPKTKKIH